EILKERLSSYQNSGGDVGYMEVIFGSKGFDEFISRFTAVTTITKADNKLIEEQKTAINKVEQKESQVKEKLSETEKNKEELKKTKKTVKSKISDLEDKKATYIAEGNDLEALENQIEEEIRESQVGISEATETISSDSSEEETTTEQAVEEDSNDSDNSNNN